jgi:competence protein ComEA
MVKIIIGVLIATVVVIAGFMILDPKISVNNNPGITETIDSDSLGGYTYTIEGEVNKPGSYALAENITMADLISAAGGVTTNADDLAFYDDATLTEGTTYYIASKYNASDICNTEPITKVNVNKDDADTLMTINGITSSIASSIVSYRTATGTFKTVEQLLEVYGIGNATYRKIRNFVTLHE